MLQLKEQIVTRLVEAQLVDQKKGVTKVASGLSSTREKTNTSKKERGVRRKKAEIYTLYLVRRL